LRSTYKHYPAAAVLACPANLYSDPDWKEMAEKHGKRLVEIKKRLPAGYGPGRMHLLTTAESAVGGVGFWGNPTRFGSPQRYLGIFARVQCPEPSSGRPFPDTQTGRVMAIMDAYGKHAIKVTADELEKMPDQQIAGAVMIFIYAKKPVTDPGFEENAEALALFMPRQSVKQFAALRMTIHTLFSSSQMLPIFQGAEQMEQLRKLIIQP